MTPCSEQRKKYSNSNIIMHETSQYHVQVRPAPEEHPRVPGQVWKPRHGEKWSAQLLIPTAGSQSQGLPHACPPVLRRSQSGGHRSPGAMSGEQRCRWPTRARQGQALGAVWQRPMGKPCGKETVILAPKQRARLGGRRCDIDTLTGLLQRKPLMASSDGFRESPDWLTELKTNCQLRSVFILGQF